MKTKDIIVSILLTTILSAFMFYLSSKNEKNLIPNDVYEVYVEGNLLPRYESIIFSHSFVNDVVNFL